jgi:hypothetical protein
MATGLRERGFIGASTGAVKAARHLASPAFGAPVPLARPRRFLTRGGEVVPTELDIEGFRVRKAKAAAVRTLDAPGRTLVLNRPSGPRGDPQVAGAAPGGLLPPLGPGTAADRIRAALRR